MCNLKKTEIHKMKKISFLMMLAALVSLTFTSCKEDTQPRLEKPTNFVLNTPAMADNLYELSADNTVEFTVSQANYGLATTPTYQVEVAASKDGEWFPVETQTTSAKISCPGEDFAVAVCRALGIDTEETFTDAVKPVFVRVHSWVPNCEYSSIYSNVIELKQVKPYYAVKNPRIIYLVGAPQGWAISDGSMPLVETGVETNIYEATYEIKENEFQFRFYAVLGDWENNSIGSQDEDATLNITLNADGVYEGPISYNFSEEKKGKGSWQIENWPGGMVHMFVDMNNNTVTFQKVN